MSMLMIANVSFLAVLMLITSQMKFINVSSLVYKYLIHLQSARPIYCYLDESIDVREDFLTLKKPNFKMFLLDSLV